MNLKDIMNHEVPTLTPWETLRRAIELFRQTRLNGIPAVDEKGCIYGLLTRTNLFDALLSGSGLEEPVDGFLIRKVRTTRADTPLHVFLQKVKNSPVGMSVVVDEYNHVNGIFTKADTIMALFKESDSLNARLQTVYHAMHNGLVSVNSAGCITMLNPAAKSLLNIQTDVIKKPVDQVLPEFDLTGVIKTGRVDVGKKCTVGSRALLVNCTPILDKESLVGAMAIFQDFTELEQVAAELEIVRTLQHTLHTVLDIAYDGIVVVNKDGIITFFNQSMAHFFGLDQKKAVGRHVSKVLENSRLHLVAQTGIAETRQLQRLGGTYYLVSCLPIIENGRVVGAVAKIMFSNFEDIRILAHRMDALENELNYYREELQKRDENKHYTFDSIISVSALMMQLKREAIKAARGLSTVLIRGESGTGKELFAQAIHVASPRREGPFIKVNCAAIPEHLLESEFFGYAPGAFTGAQRGGKPGRFELANGGTIFLDEIGDMSPGLQAKLLRVLQDREFDRVGGTSPVKVDVRVVAATNRNLDEMVEKGEFRKDLFYRLNVINLTIPPLRERPEDILPLAHCFLRKYNDILGTEVTDIATEALDVLADYLWPGNVRELENVIERAVNFTVGSIVKVGDLSSYLRQGSKKSESKTGEGKYRDLMDEAERDILLNALKIAKGNKAKAARTLNISRPRFYEKLKKLGL